MQNHSITAETLLKRFPQDKPYPEEMEAYSGGLLAAHCPKLPTPHWISNTEKNKRFILVCPRPASCHSKYVTFNVLGYSTGYVQHLGFLECIPCLPSCIPLPSPGPLAAWLLELLIYTPSASSAGLLVCCCAGDLGEWDNAETDTEHARFASLATSIYANPHLSPFAISHKSHLTNILLPPVTRSPI